MTFPPSFGDALGLSPTPPWPARSLLALPHDHGPRASRTSVCRRSRRTRCSSSGRSLPCSSRRRLDVIRAWGFTPKSELVWVKTTTPCGPELGGYTTRRRGAKTSAGLPDATAAFGMGRTARMNHETCIVATRGKTSHLVQRHDIRSVFFAPVGAHSAARCVLPDRRGPHRRADLELSPGGERGGRYTCIGMNSAQLEVGDGELFRRVGS